MEQIRRVAARRGAHGLRGMGRAFHAMDDSGNGTLDRAELKYGLRDLGVALCDDQLDQVLQAYDRNGVRALYQRLPCLLCLPHPLPPTLAVPRR